MKDESEVSWMKRINLYMPEETRHTGQSEISISGSATLKSELDSWQLLYRRAVQKNFSSSQSNTCNGI